VSAADRVFVSEASSVDRADLEIVERKGLGHPDTICDAVAESVSLALCRVYLERLGAILHHNCDKALLVAGRARHRFGGGELIEPMRLVIGDRATCLLGSEQLDVAGLATEAARTWLKENLRHVDPLKHVRFQVELRPGSEELTRLFHEKAGVLGANDTSAAVGYAPLTETERLVLEAERYLNDPSFKSAHPETGEDVKVMGVRRGTRLDLTVAMPLVDRYVGSEADYLERKERVRRALLDHLLSHVRSLGEIEIHLNALDRKGLGVEGAYLSVLGTSAEDADSGEVGRGNRANGLIAFCRPSGMEAAAGKNPVSHVGKTYSVLAHLLARRIHEEVAGVEEAVVWLCSRIGAPIDQPQIVAVRTRLAHGLAAGDIQSAVRGLVGEELERLPRFCEELALGQHKVF
jgi:S-adenosylmethionine synthetase